ncbi:MULTISPECIES: hypothetical protein [unclassified Caballeronia]|uniref:hypothetical protein n=1 Tax=unclassified Caballeronia TaxID=2646786 RepID=UPI00285D141B|nr:MULTISPECIES: hypothetical protein [unclassified Caballeronia]MDR5749608.1 hypothetical protein [Caballeronia sp. LZ024]MDR5843262.1 hypothetical protein [Caballeronia sp. LZ031]
MHHAVLPHDARSFHAILNDRVRIRRVLTLDGLPVEHSRGYKGSHLFFTTPIRTAMSAKFYFYFFWHLKPLADREG